ncbi:ABC transporter permease [Yinghuangia sp. ASG 101]|uniref:ABC transporter permease n=1 Tax=Yinghuangia sp. ASG 101 TaxID=2896848 RepID=UPI001E44CABD|nr:ABC transporter permease [Yinghuangia sp. ASG 101]UGQ11969.1 ABC transporter permease [Yinghuangia sp. ASG 101]
MAATRPPTPRTEAKEAGATAAATATPGPAAPDSAAPDPARRPRVRRLARRVATRLAGALFVLWAVVTLTFLGMHLVPGDPAEAVLGGAGSHAGEAQLAEVREQYGFDRPLLAQYADELGHLVRGDLGTSWTLRTDVTGVLGEALGSTLVLAVCSLAVAWVIAVAVALWSTRGGRISTALGTALEITAAAVPHFWLGSVLVLVLGVQLQWLPPLSTPGIEGLIMPVLTLALPLAGFLGQVMREAFLDALDAPFSLSARARGESETGLRLIHALRHAALPAISLSGWAFGSLISGAVVVETVFSRTGLGRTLLSAVLASDTPLVIGVVLVVAAVYLAVTALTEIADRIADPRLRQAVTPW